MIESKPAGVMAVACDGGGILRQGLAAAVLQSYRRISTVVASQQIGRQRKSTAAGWLRVI